MHAGSSEIRPGESCHQQKCDAEIDADVERGDQGRDRGEQSGTSEQQMRLLHQRRIRTQLRCQWTCRRSAARLTTRQSRGRLAWGMGIQVLQVLEPPLQTRHEMAFIGIRHHKSPNHQNTPTERGTLLAPDRVAIDQDARKKQNQKSRRRRWRRAPEARADGCAKQNQADSRSCLESQWSCLESRAITRRRHQILGPVPDSQIMTTVEVRLADRVLRESLQRRPLRQTLLCSRPS